MDFIALENEEILLVPLNIDDYARLYDIARNREIWTQHPVQDRYTPEKFQVYFDSLLNCDIAYLIVNKPSNDIIGATSFYNFDKEEKKVTIGYTFLSPEFVDHIIFHVGATNFRSQKAIQKLGAQKTGEFLKRESPQTHNYEYTLTKI